MAERTAAQELVQFPGPGEDFTAPYYVAGAPGDPSRVFVVEGAGKIQLVKDGVLQPTPFLDIAGDVCDEADGCGFEGGMYSIAFDPGYADNGLFYVVYAHDIDPGTYVIRLEEFQRSDSDPDVADITSRRVVLEIEHSLTFSHNGGQLQFGPDGLLYWSVGDGGLQPASAQVLGSRFGKLLRIDPHGSAAGDYAIPPGNPFADGAGGNADEIYAYGLRNPFRFSFDRLTGDLAIADVGEDSWEEADIVPNGAGRGANFGWPCYEGTHVHPDSSGVCNPLPANHTPPVLEYPHSGGGAPAAIAGGYVVRDTTLPTLLGRYLYADTYDTLGDEIYSAPSTPGVPTAGTSTGMSASFVVSFGEDACAHVYVASQAGPVYRIQPSTSQPACAPQGIPIEQRAASDSTGPHLSVNRRGARRAARRGRVTLIVSCDEPCRLQGSGRIGMPGKDIRLGSDSSGPAPAGGTLDLPLSATGARRLGASLDSGRRARAMVRIDATDAAGNRSVLRLKIRQRH